MCTDRCRGRSRPVTPAASQLRMIAPRLPGSVTPSTATRNGLVFAVAADQVAEIGFGHLGRQRQHALGGVGARLVFELALRDVPQRNPPRRGDLHDVGDAGVALEFRADPDLVDLAPLGHEQFADGLATLDLLAAEALRSTGRPRRGARALPDPLTRPRTRRWTTARRTCRLATRRCAPDDRRTRRRSDAPDGRTTCPNPAPCRSPCPDPLPEPLPDPLPVGRLMWAPSVPLSDQRGRETHDAFAPPDCPQLLGPVALDRHRSADRIRQNSSASPTRAGASFGRSQTTAQSMLTTAHDSLGEERRRRGGAARSSRRRPRPGRCRGSARRCRRARPRRASASAQACAITSASLWPSRPRSPSNTTPPSTRTRAGSSVKRWTSKPWPTRMSAEADTSLIRTHRRRSARRAQSRSSGSVILRFVRSPATTTTRPPNASTSAASSVAEPGLAVGGAQRGRRNAWGVCTATSVDRSGVDTTAAPSMPAVVGAVRRP